MYFVSILTGIGLIYFYGEVNFKELGNFTGKYGVGSCSFWTKKLGNFVTVYYPIDKKLYEELKNDPNQMKPYFNHGENGKRG